MPATDAQVNAIRAIADIIEETATAAGSAGAPSGHIYAALMTTGLTLDTYQQMLSLMEHTGRIKVRHDVVYAGASK